MNYEADVQSNKSPADAIHFSMNDCWDVHALLRAICVLADDVSDLPGVEADAIADSIRRLARMGQAQIQDIAGDLDLACLSMADTPRTDDPETSGVGHG